MKFSALLAPALLLAGCAAVPPPAVPQPAPHPPRPGPMIPYTPVAEGVHFTVEPRIAAPGATVSLMLHNGTASQIGYNLCDSGLEQLQGSTWRALPPDGVCTQELRTLAPGQHVRYPRRLPATLAAGTYRFRTGIESPLNRGTPGLQQIHSEPFTVRR